MPPLFNRFSSQADVQILQQCNKDDSCHCKNLSSLKALPWSNTFSRSFKQLSLTRSPQVFSVPFVLLKTLRYNPSTQYVRKQSWHQFFSFSWLKMLRCWDYSWEVITWSSIHSSLQA